MPARKYSARMDPELYAEVIEAAHEDSVSVSAWLAEAVRQRLHFLELERLLAEFEQEHGEFTVEEMAEAFHKLQHPWRPEHGLSSGPGHEAS